MFSNAVAGESALDRMACGLGGKLVLPMIKEHIMQMLQNRKLQQMFRLFNLLAYGMLNLIVFYQ